MIPLTPDFMDDASYPMLRYPVIICRSLTEGLDTLEISKAKKNCWVGTYIKTKETAGYGHKTNYKYYI